MTENPTTFGCSDTRLECEDGRPIKKVRVFMNSRGCRYAKRKECLHCSFFSMASESLTAEDMFQSFKREFDKYDFREHPILAVFPPGSFLDDGEIFPEARERILQVIDGEKSIKTVIIETRPEFVTEKKMSDIAQALPGKRVLVSMGLESSNDFVRNKYLNKSFTWKDYTRAANIIKKYCELRSYVLLKPPFMTEGEAINDAINSIEDAFSIGSESVFLEICNVQKGSPLEALYDIGLYKPASLWSVTDVLSKFEGERVFVGSVNDYPRTKAEASNCEQCTDIVKRELVDYNSHLNLEKLKAIDCGCRYSADEKITASGVRLLPPL